MNCGPSADAPMRDDVTDDAFLGGRLRLLQPRRGHRSGHDAMLLAAATAARRGDGLAEFGSGIGAAALAVAARLGGLQLTLVDIEASLVALAIENVRRNGFVANGVCLDVASSAAAFTEAGLSPDLFDHVIMNPPFNDSVRHQPSPDRQRRLAHEARESTIAAWIHAARRVLKPSGIVTLIWRAEALDEVLAALRTGFGGIAILPVHPRQGAAASRILLRAEKGSRAPTTLLEGIALNDAEGRPTDYIRAVLEGREVLPLAKM